MANRRATTRVAPIENGEELACGHIETRRVLDVDGVASVQVDDGDARDAPARRTGLIAEALLSVAGDQKRRNASFRRCGRGRRSTESCGARCGRFRWGCVARSRRPALLSRRAGRRRLRVGRNGWLSRAARPVALELVRLRFHHRHHPLRPVAAGERRVRVREDLGDDIDRGDRASSEG